MIGRLSRKLTVPAMVSGAMRLAAGVTPGTEATSSVSTAPGQSAVTTARQEADQVELLSGVYS